MRLMIFYMLLVLGFVVAAYVCFWVCIMSGAFQIIDAIKEEPTDRWQIALGVLRILFSSVFGYSASLWKDGNILGGFWAYFQRNGQTLRQALDALRPLPSDY